MEEPVKHLSQTCPNVISSGKPLVIPSARTAAPHTCGGPHSHRWHCDWRPLESCHMWLSWQLPLCFHGACYSVAVMSDPSQPHGLQYTRLLCPSLSPRVCSYSCPLSWWCHPTISSSVVPFSSCLQSFPASGCFPVSQLFTSSGQSIGASASASVLPMNIEDWFPLGLTGLISLLSQGLSRVFSSTIVQKHQFFGAQPSLWSNSHIRYMTTGGKVHGTWGLAYSSFHTLPYILY